MLGEMPWRVWNEWLLFNRDERIDESVNQYLLAQIGMLIARAWLKRTDSKDWTTEDFLPIYGKAIYQGQESEAERAERLLQFARDMTRLMGGDINDGTRTEAG